MESFFVPIYLKLGKLSEEKLLIALIAVTPKKIMLNYSQKRIHLSAQVINTGYAQLAKEVLEQIQNKANEVNATLNNPNQIHFENTHVFNADYFEYIKKYSQNTLLFGNVEAFNFKDLLLDFKSLFESLMNEKPEEIKHTKQSFISKIKIKLKAANIETKADIGYTITPSILKGLYNDTTVSLITKNGGILAAEAIDFNNGIPSLNNSLCAFEVLINSLNQFSTQHKLKPATYHILNSVPASGSEQEKLLNNIFKNKNELYKVVPEGSMEEITNKIKAGNYKKFSTTFV